MAEQVYHPPLNYEASNTTTHPIVSSSLPREVVTCLKNARFLHLATITNPTPTSPALPHVSLMNYTFLPGGFSHPTSLLPPYPTIIMTTNPKSLKTQNLLHNPRVSLLVHDWVSHRPPTTVLPGGGEGRSGSPPAAATRSSLASMLLNMNTSALSSISTTITGEAVFLEKGSAEERWCKEAHLANNTFGDQAREEAGLFGEQPPSAEASECGASGMSSCYIEGEDVRVVIVRVREGRIADWKGGVHDWVVIDEDETEKARVEDLGDRGVAEGRGRRPQDHEPLVNGVAA